MRELSEKLQEEITDALKLKIAESGGNCELNIHFGESSLKIRLDNAGITLGVEISNECVREYLNGASQFVLHTVKRYARQHGFKF